MANLIILGNGFDLAHGLKTSYGDFIKSIIQCNDLQSLNPGIFPNKIRYTIKSDFTTALSKGNAATKIFQRIYLKHKKNWSDIECDYFEALLEIINESKDSNSNFYTDPQELNTDFECIKDELKKYLLSINPEEDIELLKYFFSKICDRRTLILNFNYTNTITSLYGQHTNESEIIHIHGELFNEENPVIFGFAASYKYMEQLLDQNNNDYLQNIKRYEYKKTNNERRLRHFLDSQKNINIYLLGHSCGISDQFVLNEIFNHENIRTTNILYYETQENFIELVRNIDRVTSASGAINKILDFKNSCRVPQLKDDPDKKKDTHKQLVKDTVHMIV